MAGTQITHWVSLATAQHSWDGKERTAVWPGPHRIPGDKKNCITLPGRPQIQQRHESRWKNSRVRSG